MLGVAELLTGGTTSVLTMESDRHTGAAFEAAATLGIRATIGKALMDRYEPGTEMEVADPDTAWAEQLRLVDTWHNHSEGRLRVALSPRGPRNATPETWRRCVALADEADLRLHTHVNENQVQADLLGASPEGRDLEALNSWGALSPRLVMAHAVWLSGKEPRPRSQTSPARVSLSIVKLEAGIGAGTDPRLPRRWPKRCARRRWCPPATTALDAFEEMRLAALIHKPAAGPRAVPARTAFEMATMAGARALGLAAEIGSLEVGKRADVVVLRRDGLHNSPLGGADVFSQIVYAHRASDVDTVVVDGQLVVAEGRLLTGNESAIRAEAEAQQSALVARTNRAS